MKAFFTYEQQINKLKDDGLIITDDAQAIEQLRLEGYYNIINGYSPIFKNGAAYVRKNQNRYGIKNRRLEKSNKTNRRINVNEFL